MLIRSRWRLIINTLSHQNPSKVAAAAAMATTTTTSSDSNSNPPPKTITFGPYEVTSQVFLTTPHSFALVNLKPLLPGHVLVCPLAPHRRLAALSAAEVTDLFTTVQRVQGMLARRYFSSPSPPSSSSPPGEDDDKKERDENGGGSFNIALQDGPEAGQTVAHVHVHVIPRVRGVSAKPDDGTAGDALYEQMAGEAGNVGGALWDRDHHKKSREEEEEEEDDDKRRPTPGGRFDRIEDSARVARGRADMEAEAAEYRRILDDMEQR